ncbi:hypothetical protein ACFY05_32365 [Microtetraspora fusca]|uniref:Uncharacterized protein n=1 Tax=Microtetraspora fusca TaxID=1997 RepID=A0ABW6VHG3_MICFU
MPQPRDHVIRPLLPWRSPGNEITECGRPAGDVRSAITQDELKARIREMGKQRAALFTCMTCLDTAANWATFQEDPVQVIYRESYTNFGGRQVYGGLKADVFADELRALAELVARHRDEFDTILAAFGDAVRLDDLRRQRAARR